MHHFGTHSGHLFNVKGYWRRAEFREGKDRYRSTQLKYCAIKGLPKSSDRLNYQKAAITVLKMLPYPSWLRKRSGSQDEGSRPAFLLLQWCTPITCAVSQPRTPGIGSGRRCSTPRKRGIRPRETVVTEIGPSNHRIARSIQKLKEVDSSVGYTTSHTLARISTQTPPRQRP
jgi:hypothetical protein